MQKYLVTCEKTLCVNKISIQGNFQIELEAKDENDAHMKAFNIIEKVFHSEDNKSYYMRKIGFCANC